MDGRGVFVMKFGGAAVASPGQFLEIAKLIVEKKKLYPKLIVVVSAMADMTNQLVSLANSVSKKPPQREYDMLVTVGERISISLLAMALKELGVEAVSFTGSQSGIITCERHMDARILDVRPRRILSTLQQGKIAIVAGFQGVSREGEITTLGRGGSDTTATALGACFCAEGVEFYKYVAGVYSEDPEVNPFAEFFSHLGYDEAIRLAEKKGKFVLDWRCLQLAKANRLPLFVRSFRHEVFERSGGTQIGETVCKKRPLSTTVYEKPLDPCIAT